LRKETTPINNQIRAKRVILIDETGIKLGEFMKSDAISTARDRGFDLVQVGGPDNKPICKMMDYGKYQYDKKKKMKKNPSATIKVKEINLRPNTDEHDYQVRLKQAEKFLSQGNKVKLTVKFKGREGAHLDIVRERCLEFANELREISDIESNPARSGRGIMMILAPKRD
jgi:translation initiation factor IF-3